MCENDTMTFQQVEHLIKRGDLLSLRRQLDDGLDPNLSSPNNYTLLMVAASHGNTQIGELLLSRGADVNIVTKHGTTALTAAAGKGHLPFVQVLLARGANTNVRQHGWSISHLMTMTGVPKEKRLAILNAMKATGTSRRSVVEYLRSFLR
jgi:uncharacterized protein